jgi:group II intron reverse transcriptase/maturase
MTRQIKEDPAVSEGGRKVAPTRGVEPPGGEKGIPVNQRAEQLALFSETAEHPSAVVAPGAVGGADLHPSRPATRAVPKSEIKDETATPATMEEVTLHLRTAFQKVASNRGAPGPDGQSIEEVRKRLDDVLPTLAAELLEGSYAPGAIRRVWIPKADGSQRGLGIPDVIDRMVQEAVRQVLEPLYEPTFHASSHGFRPGRSCHTAIDEARGHVDEGHEWVVDLDLKKFFDRVNHQRLLARLAQRVEDKRLLALIDRWMKAEVVMPDGVKVSTDEGLPQGGPLSPLLSNIVLDELDRELARRGHRFVRYADDCNIYVRSERAGQRVMESVSRFIERRLRLEVNQDKSAVARTERRHFVGFRLRRKPLDGSVDVLLSKRSKERIDARIRELTPRTWGGSLRACITRINVYLRGWFGFFGICTGQTEGTLSKLDAHIRRRLRAIQLHHWKRRRTMARKLVQLGVRRKTAWRRIYAGRKSLWALSHDPAVDRGLRNAYFAERGLESLAAKWCAKHQAIVAPAQLMLALG